MRFLPLLIAALFALVVSACGSTGDPDASPASLAPAGAPLYFEVTARPEGDLRTDAVAAARTILRTEDPIGQLRKAIDRELAEDGASLAKDVDPWLGKRIGVVVTGVQGEEPRFAAIAATEDVDQAVDSVVASAERDDTRFQERSHNDVDYRIDDEGFGVAAVGDFLVIGDEQTLRQVIDVEKGKRSLSDEEAFTKATGAVAKNRLGMGWVDFGGLTDLLGRAPGFSPQEAGILRQFLTMQGLEGLAFALTADQNAVRLDSAVIGGTRQARQAADPAAAAQALRALPAGSLVGLGVANVGDQIRMQLDQLGQLGALSGQDPQQILGQIEAATGLNLEEDLLRWMEQGSIFVQGSSLADIGGALIVQSSDPRASLNAIERIAPLLERGAEAELEEIDRGGVRGLEARFDGLPLPVFLVVAQERFIVALGRPALDSAVDPQGSLGRDPAFSQAARTLGEGIQPTFFASVPRILELARVPFGQEPGFQQVSRYLGAFTAVAAGAAREGEVTRGQLALGLRRR